jgi:hypothetical protein
MICLYTSISFLRDFDVVMKSLSDAWNRGDHWSTRQQILAVIAGDLRSDLIKQYFPGVSTSQIKKARRHAYSTGKILIKLARFDKSPSRSWSTSKFGTITYATIFSKSNRPFY